MQQLLRNSDAALSRPEWRRSLIRVHISGGDIHKLQNPRFFQLKEILMLQLVLAVSANIQLMRTNFYPGCLSEIPFRQPPEPRSYLRHKRCVMMIVDKNCHPRCSGHGWTYKDLFGVKGGRFGSLNLGQIGMLYVKSGSLHQQNMI